jgi:hypothetical protein
MQSTYVVARQLVSTQCAVSDKIRDGREPQGCQGLLGKRMEWISDYRFERQTPGIMNLRSNTGARISPVRACFPHKTAESNKSLDYGMNLGKRTYLIAVGSNTS